MPYVGDSGSENSMVYTPGPGAWGYAPYLHLQLNTTRSRTTVADILIFVTQTKPFILISILLVLIYLFVFNEKRRGGKTLTCAQVTRLLNNNEGVLVDVRDTAEFNAGHIVDALHIPFNKISERWEELLPHKEKEIVLVDKMGQHAGSAGAILRSKEFQVSRLGGGMMEWQGQNLPVVK